MPPGEIVEQLDASLEPVDDLVAVYLHGSAALGGFVAGRSDVDVLVVVEDRRFERDELEVMAEAIRATAAALPGRGLELSVVAERHARAPAPPWPFLLHVATDATEPKTVLGAGHPGDRDLLMHYVVCRAAGVAVRGPAPRHLIGDVDRSVVLSYLVDELEWGVHHASEAYAVLNACRALVYADRGESVSKVAGATLARQLGGSDALIDHALAMHRGAVPEHPPSEEARRFVMDVRRALRQP